MSDKKEKVLETATKLFAELGFEKTSMALICKEAKVSKGLVYHHFESKESILIEIFTSSTHKIIESNVIVDETIEPKDELKQLINNVFYQLENDKLFFQFNLNIMFQPSTRSLLEEHIKERADILFKSVKRIFDKISIERSEIQAYTLLAEIDGITLNYLSVFEKYPLLKMKSELINKYTK
ncbi:TetR family transcriptional regulator [Flavobacterium sp. LMO8]|uniref:TetR/AcrR family transcriptional regulator n=1 Tax=Flavobacterium sp. LMO8 TaxID=2654244 RepID=UPI001290BEC5|nr:TetR/AcrR family transcriptional regulator [Flavobacterium sp. LMO8]MQP23800.1 TetR family transcriptional regulator [Flavobacterium sp. LMO8]